MSRIAQLTNAMTIPVLRIAPARTIGACFRCLSVVVGHARRIPGGGRGSDGSANWANLGCRKVLARLEGNSRPFRQLMEPHAAHVSASKRIALPVLAEKRSHSSVLLESRNGAAHTSCPACFKRCRRVCTRAAMSSALDPPLLIDLALIVRLSNARLIRKSFTVKSWRVS